MTRLLLFCLLATLLGVTPLSSQEEEKKPARLQVGSVLSGSFDCFNLNGKFKDRQHCLVTDFGLRPVVMVFAREAPEEKEGAVGKLLSSLDEAVEKYADQELRACVIYLSPFARSSATDAAVDDPVKLVEEAKEREALLKRLDAKAEKLKNVVIGTYPAKGPPGYNIDARDAVTVIFYRRLKVADLHGYAEGQLRPQDVEALMQKVQSELKK
jgi:hypothetical protein